MKCSNKSNKTMKVQYEKQRIIIKNKKNVYNITNTNLFNETNFHFILYCIVVNYFII